MKAIILAAGRGRRFGSLTLKVPKPLVLVAQKPLIYHVLDILPRVISEYIIVVGYLGHLIKDRLGFEYLGKPIHYVQQDKPGTGGALMSAKNFLANDNNFLVVGSDDIFGKGELDKLICRQATYGIYFGHPSKPSLLGVKFDGNKQFVGFVKTADPFCLRYHGVGAYVLPYECFSVEMVRLRSGEISLPHSLAFMKFPIKVIEINEWVPVNNESERRIAEKQIAKIPYLPLDGQAV